jgi:hypothetical protein
LIALGWIAAVSVAIPRQFRRQVIILDLLPVVKLRPPMIAAGLLRQRIMAVMAGPRGNG